MDSASRQHGGQRNLVYLQAGLLVLIGCAIYYNSLQVPFQFDDNKHIVRSRAIERLWPPWHLIAGTRRPLIRLSLAANYAMHGRSVVGYHLTNVAVHLGAALVLMGIVRRLVIAWRTRTGGDESTPRGNPVVVGATSGDAIHGDGNPSGRAGIGTGSKDAWQSNERAESAAWIGFAVALLWMVHPLQTQAVTYIIQRAESMTALLYLLTVYAVVRAASGTRSERWQIAAVVFCALGMGCKAVMVSAPLIALLVDRTFFAGDLPTALRRRWKMYVGLGLTWLVLLGALSAERLFRTPTTAGFGGQGIYTVTWWRYAASQPGVILHYLRLAIWPHPLCFDYGWPPVRTVPQALLPALPVLALLVATFWYVRKGSWLGVVGATFFLVLAPTSSIVPIADLAVEHRMYLPLAPVIVLAVVAWETVVARAGNPGRWRAISRGAVMAAALLLGMLTIRRNEDYISPRRLWATVVKTAPHHYRGHNNLANELLSLGHWGAAMEHYQRALELQPDVAEGHRNLGRALIQAAEVARRQGDAKRHDELIAAAIKQHRKALELKPGLAEAHSDLGVALATSGQIDDAIVHYRKALELQPKNAVTHGNLGAALARRGQLKEAIVHFRRAVEIRPSAISHDNLAKALARAGRHVEARMHVLEAQRLKKDQ